MNTHINIRLNGKELNTSESTSLGIDFSNPLFHDTEAVTLPFSVNAELNRDALGIVDDPDAGARPFDMEGIKAEVLADGMLLVNGKLVTDDESEVKDNFSFNVDNSHENFRTLINNLKCTDIPVIDDIKIGETLGDIKVNVGVVITRDTSTANWTSGTTNHGTAGSGSSAVAYEYSINGEFDVQALGFSYPAKCVVGNLQKAVQARQINYPDNAKVIVPEIDVSYINVTQKYPDKKYCNARVCYKHYGRTLINGNPEQGETIKEVISPRIAGGAPEDYWPYWVLDAARPQSGICFYVLYFLDCLFKHLGIAFDNSELLQVEDLKRLCFFTTKCKFRKERLLGTENTPYFVESYRPAQKKGGESTKHNGEYSSEHLPHINDWLKSRGCGGTLDVYTEYKFGGTFGGANNTSSSDSAYDIPGSVTIDEQYTVSANIFEMFATEENFPDVSVSSVIESLENAFGIRFLFDNEMHSCKAVLIRNIMKKRTPVKMMGRVLECYPVNEKISGVRIHYDQESDSNEQKEFVKQGKKDYDTRYDYTDFRDSNVKFKSYTDLYRNVSASDSNVYIDLSTGNAYRIKVDQDAKTFNELKPVIFQVAHLKGAEIGDCSEDNEDFIEDISIGIEPVDITDVNYRQELNMQYPAPVNAVFIDEDMEHEFITQVICNTMSIQPTPDPVHFPTKHWNIECSLAEVLNTVENYDPTQTEDGNSPLQHIDWGMAMALMRGGEEGVETASPSFEDMNVDFDGFGNSQWRTLQGDYNMDIDSMNVFGNEYDYDGSSQPGVGEGERFSLKIQAYKPFRYRYVNNKLEISKNPKDWENDPSWLMPCNDDSGSSGNQTKIRTRGLYDTFLADYVHFLLNRKKLRFKILTTTAQLIDIKNHWTDWYEIDGKYGLIDKAEADFDNINGLGIVTIDLLSI